MLRSISLCFALTSLVACASQDARATPAPHRASTADDQALCVQLFTRARACTDAYIPALVDARAKFDKPPGIAAKVAADRDGIIAEAKAEWAEDSKDAAIAANCAAILQSLADEDRDPALAHSCLAKPDCGEFATCVMPIFEKRFNK